jgi:hypothetical protein
MRLPLCGFPWRVQLLPGAVRPMGRQKAKGKNELPCRKADTMFNAVTHPKFLPFAFCLLPFAFTRSVHDH